MDLTQEPPRCKLATFMDLVSGKNYQAFCKDFRQQHMPCGFEAKLFESATAQVTLDRN